MTSPGRLSTLPSADDVLGYWRALGPQRWFVKDTAIDAEIRDKFQNLHAAAIEGLLGAWEDDASGAPAHVMDFFIGAHAAVAEYRLLTRNAVRYRTYFPKLPLIAPS